MSLTPDAPHYWRDRLATEVSLRTTGWERLGFPFNRALYRQRLRVLRRTLRACDVRIAGARICEVAPGTGVYLTEWLARGAASVQAVDVSPDACALVRERFPAIDVLCADWTTIDVARWEPFDVVTAFDVLFHLTDPARHREAVLNLARACRPGGWVLFSDTLPRHPGAPAAEFRLYTHTEYAALLAEAGLQVERMAPLFVFMHPWFDTRSRAVMRVFNTLWFAFEALLFRLPWLGYPAGWVGELLDGGLTRLLRRGPSQKLVVCRRVGSPPAGAAPAGGTP